MSTEQLTDDQIIALAQDMTDAARLKLIEEIAAVGTPWAHRIARWLMDLHPGRGAKTPYSLL